MLKRPSSTRPAALSIRIFVKYCIGVVPMTSRKWLAREERDAPTLRPSSSTDHGCAKSRCSSARARPRRGSFSALSQPEGSRSEMLRRWARTASRNSSSDSRAMSASEPGRPSRTSLAAKRKVRCIQCPSGSCRVSKRIRDGRCSKSSECGPRRPPRKPQINRVRSPPEPRWMNVHPCESCVATDRAETGGWFRSPPSRCG